MKRTNAGIWKNLLRKAFTEESMGEFLKTSDMNVLRARGMVSSVSDQICNELGTLSSPEERASIYLKAVEETPGISSGTRAKLRRRLGI